MVKFYYEYQARLDERGKNKAVEIYIRNWEDILRRENDEDVELASIVRNQHLSRMVLDSEGQIATLDNSEVVRGTIHSLTYSIEEMGYIEGMDQLTNYLYGRGAIATHDSRVCYAIQTEEGIGGAARFLIETQRKLAAADNKRLFAYTRPNGYSDFLRHYHLEDSDEIFMDYLDFRLHPKSVDGIRNDGVSLHLHLGAQFAPLLRDGRAFLPNSRPADWDSKGYNVLMGYTDFH